MLAVIISMKYLILVVTLAFAQADLERVFHFTHTSSPQSLNEIATVVRSITDVRSLNVDAEQKTITFSGTPGQGTLADWLLAEMDRKERKTSSPAAYKADLPAAFGELTVKVFHLQHTKPGQDLQELATVVRSTAAIRRLMTYRALTTLVARGTEDQVLLAEMLVADLDRPSTASREAREYRVPGSSEEFVKVVFMPTATEPEALMRLATKVRTSAQIRQVFVSASRNAIVIRGTAEQMVQATQTLAGG